jgi:ABC-type transport system substrate-binding protein
MTHRFLWFRSALALAAFSLLLAACGGAAPAAPAGEATAPAAATDAPAAVEPTMVADATEAPTTAAAEPTTAAATTDPKETIVYAGDLSDQISLDPAVAYEFGGILPVGHIYQTLVTLAPGESEVKPLLAKSWDVKDSGDTWTLTFALDENAKFASGNPVTADDVVYSWGRVIDLNKAPAFLFNDVAGLTKESFKAVDPQTLEVTLAKTTSPQVFLSVLSFSVAGVVEKAVLEANAGSDMGSTWLNDHSAGVVGAQHAEHPEPQPELLGHGARDQARDPAQRDRTGEPAVGDRDGRGRYRLGPRLRAGDGA